MLVQYDKTAPMNDPDKCDEQEWGLMEFSQKQLKERMQVLSARCIQWTQRREKCMSDVLMV